VFGVEVATGATGATGATLSPELSFTGIPPHPFESLVKSLVFGNLCVEEEEMKYMIPRPKTANRIYLTYLALPEDMAGRYFSDVLGVSEVLSVVESRIGKVSKVVSAVEWILNQIRKESI
jgi:hypothetical protein